MVNVTLLAFAGAAESLGWRAREVSAEASDTARALLSRVAPDYVIGTARVAVNCEYADWDAAIGAEAREVAIIPPVSGG